MGKFCPFASISTINLSEVLDGFKSVTPVIYGKKCVCVCVYAGKRRKETIGIFK